MRHSAIWWAFGLVAAAGIYSGCTQDFSQFEPTGSGGSASTSSGAGNNGGGGSGAGGCMVARDCPAATKACEVAACTNGNCEIVNENDSSPCNANGGAVCLSGTCVECIAPGDCGDTANDCKQFSCDGNNKCQLGNKPDDTPCGATGNLNCKNGVCQGCSGPGDCGVDTECVTFACDGGGHCSNMNTADGTPTTNQTPGDCMQNQCMNGVETAVVQDDPPADDGNACTDELCQGGTPIHQNKNVNDACGGGNVCDNANPPNCVECTPTSNNCGGSQVCFMEACCSPANQAAACMNKCTGNASDGCGGMVGCDLNACGNPANFECNTMNLCCAKPSLQTACGTQCTGMKTDSCGVSRTCNATVCTAQQTCFMNNCCTKTPKATACGNMCGGGTVSDGCGGMYTCNDGASCTSGFCVDGACCNSACTGTCMTCTTGTCSPLNGAQDPNTCDDTNGGCGTKCSCDAGGACKRKTGEACGTGNQNGSNSNCASGTCAAGLCT